MCEVCTKNTLHTIYTANNMRYYFTGSLKIIPLYKDIEGNIIWGTFKLC